MKSLLKYLSPFAPDLAGAVSVLFELDGLIVICDAGGCTGNICGFDEPRWFTQKSALFSAGLRDMDAILGRDRLLADKLIAAAQSSQRKFAVMIGSPVPAVIATDFTALKRMCQKKLDIPVMAIEACGTLDYEVGASAAYCELFKTFAQEKYPVKADAVGVLGVTPLDCSTLDAAGKITQMISGDLRCYGMNSTLADIVRASEVSKNLVVAPAALKCAQMLERKFGTPYEIAVPFLPENTLQAAINAAGKNVLIVHQVFAARALQQKLQAISPDSRISCGSFFNKYARGDYKFASENDFAETVAVGNFDVIIADDAFRRIVEKSFHGQWIDFTHFAVSGNLLEEE